MIIHKHIEKKVSLDYFFVKGKLNINCKYFIDKIKIGCERQDNKNYQTNVKDKMTSFTFFNNDPEFLKILDKMIDYVDDHFTFPSYSLVESWGVSCSYGSKTVEHNHRSNEWSGVIYLNSHEQTLDFNDINQIVKPEPGAFAIFSPFLLHKADKHRSQKIKYGISFNLKDNGC
jgi:hypothetical protein|tara:strand:- start:1383 stop:1901 length:519 start_codon:yes stop_codon:yes gene_type:complete